MRTSLLILILVSCSIINAQGPARIEILNADQWEFDEEKAPGAQRLIGNVRFKHENAVMSCDSAYLYKDQRMQAFGRVRMTQGDTLSIQGDRLDYDGNTRIAEINGDVVLIDKDIRLTTDRLSYDLKGRQARYVTGGTIVSRKENNTLTSRRGLYLATGKEFIFSDSVRLDHPERKIRSDTLRYQTSSGITHFGGPTWIDQGGTRIYCEQGWYDTRTDRSRLLQGAHIWYDGQELLGDSIDYDKKTGIGEAWGQVSMIDTANDLLVTGGYGLYEEITGNSIVTDSAQLIILMGEDSLFLHADTLRAISNDAGDRILHAFHGVRFFKHDLQGVCDSLVYPLADSLIHFLHAPFLWNGTDQISGDTIRLSMRNGQADRLFVEENAMMVSQVDSSRFDQIIGSRMEGIFRDNALRKIIAEGNCRTVYFAREEQQDGKEKILGVNRADCSRIEVRVGATTLDRITFITQPDAVMYPLDKAPEEEIRLEGIVWNDAQRPVDRWDIFRE